MRIAPFYSVIYPEYDIAVRDFYRCLLLCFVRATLYCNGNTAVSAMKVQLHRFDVSFPPDPYLLSLQTMLAKGQTPTQHTAGAFLDALKLNGQADRCVTVFSEMMDSGVDVGDVCFNIVVSALVKVRQVTHLLASCGPK